METSGISIDKRDLSDKSIPQYIDTRLRDYKKGEIKNQNGKTRVHEIRTQ